MKFVIRFNGHPVEIIREGRHYALASEAFATHFTTEAEARTAAVKARLRPAPLVEVTVVTPVAEQARFKRDHPLHGKPMRPVHTGD